MKYQDQRKLALKLFQGDKYIELRKAIMEGKCFNVILPIAEKAGAIEFWDQFIEEWIFRAGYYWAIPKEMLIEAFPKLEGDEWIFRAGRYWAIPEGMLKEAILNGCSS